MPKLAIVIPVGNESESIGPLLTKFEDALAGYPGRYRIIVVDGVSSDRTSPFRGAAGSKVKDQTKKDVTFRPDPAAEPGSSFPPCGHA